MKKYLSLILSICFITLCVCFSSCKTKSENDKLNVVCTIFPLYDWTNNVIGENGDKYNVSVLAENGVDMHSFQPSASDIANISKCDLFIYVGGESDAWVEKALLNPINKNRKVLNLIAELGDKAKDEEEIEGAEEHSHDEHDHDEHEKEKDEHIWLSLKNAEYCASKISNALCVLDDDNKRVYENNFTDYTEKIRALDDKYKEEVANAKYKTLVFADRFPFRYMTDDYELTYYAAFSGCSAETEASFATIVFLAGKIDELSLPSICVIESGNGKIADTVKKATSLKNQKIVAFDSMQNITKKDMDGGANYLSIMEKNLQALKTALN